jgi:hypothetical protein
VDFVNWGTFVPSRVEQRKPRNNARPAVFRHAFCPGQGDDDMSVVSTRNFSRSQLPAQLLDNVLSIDA